MAQKRMFSLSVVDTDNFLEMPISSRLLYYELGMRADDDGFVGNWKKILTFTGLKVDDMKVLIAKQFVILFESGVIVIRHWRLNNYLQKDRVKPTVYKEELAQLDVDENNVYNVYTNCIHSIDKNSIDKNRKEKEKTKNEIDELIKSNFTDKEIIDAIYEFIKMRKTIKKPLTTRGLQLMIKKLYSITTDVDEQVEIVNNSIMNNWQGIFPLKEKKQKYTGGFDDFKELWEEAKIQDEQAGDNRSASNVGW